MKMKQLLSTALILLCGSGIVEAASDEVNLYSARKEALIKPLLDRFTQETGIEVNLVTGKADALLKRLETEGINSPADLIVTTDAGRLYRAKSADLLQPVQSDKLEQLVPANLRDPDDYWYGLSVRARPIFYAIDRVKPGELSTYEALADAKWKGRICIRSSENIYNQSLVASMIASRGDAATQQWAESLVANLARPPKGGDRDQIKAVAAGQCDVAIANTYYYGGMLTSGDESQLKAAQSVAIFWPNQGERGTHINVSGIGMTKSAKNSDNAIRLMEFLADRESQQWYAEVNHEYPVVTGVEKSDLLKSWGEFEADALALFKLGELNADAVRLMDRAHWR